MDMHRAYWNAVDNTRGLEHVAIVHDPFHIMKLRSSSKVGAAGTLRPSVSPARRSLLGQGRDPELRAP
jgi:hypothetical protein